MYALMHVCALMYVRTNVKSDGTIQIYIYIYIRRPLPSLGLGGAAPGITVGVRHGLVPALASKPQNLRSSFRRRAACLAMVPP